MKVFMTGATGWIGRHAVPELLEGGHQILALARSDEAAKQLADQGVSVIRGALEDTDILHESAKKADAVLHLAYILDYDDFFGRPARVDHAAIRAMASALEGTGKTFVLTAGVLGAKDETEQMIPGPRREAENILFEYASRGVKPISVRVTSFTHGKGDYKGMLTVFIKKAIKFGYSAYVGGGENEWAAGHVKDDAKLFRIALEKSYSGEIGEKTVLHGNAEGVRIKDIMEKISHRLDSPVKVLENGSTEAEEYFGMFLPFITLDTSTSNEITKKLTGWSPKEISLLEELDGDWYFDLAKSDQSINI